jgi:non-specific serine/threonine protein kinase
MLLVLDNCEHLLDACAALVDLLVRECPMLHVMATSREPLGIPGEVVWIVSPLEVPESRESVSLAEIERSPAVHLFVDRAAAAQQSFVFDVENADAVAQICRRLDGMPLALELAAARLDALSPHELAARLDSCFSLLRGGNRGAPPRQQTLGATIDWSYQSLTPTQQRVFERLAVVANGWTLDAANAVCAGDGVAADGGLDALLQLVRKSLVTRIDVRHGSARYGMLETLRQYARQKLGERDAELASARARHAAYYLAMTERLDPASSTTLLPFSGEAVSAPVFAILDDAHDNIQLAFAWCLETRHANEGLLLIRALAPLWMWVGLPPDGPRWMAAMLELAASTPGVQQALFAQALTLGGIVAQMDGDPARSRSLLEASVAAWRPLGDTVGLAMAFANLGYDHVARGEFAQGEAVLYAGLDLARDAGEPFTLDHTLTNVARLEYARQRYSSAVAFASEGLAVARTLERSSYRTFATVWALVTLGHAESKLGATAEARLHFEEALVALREVSQPGFLLAACLEGMAATLSICGDLVRSARLFGAAARHWHTIRVSRLMFVEQRDAEAREVEAHLGPAAFQRAWNDGHALNYERALAQALAACV